MSKNDEDCGLLVALEVSCPSHAFRKVHLNSAWRRNRQTGPSRLQRERAQAPQSTGVMSVPRTKLRGTKPSNEHGVGRGIDFLEFTFARDFYLWTSARRGVMHCMHGARRDRPFLRVDSYTIIEFNIMATP